MSGLRDAVADYLTIRRALGFKLADHEWALESFVVFLERAGASAITTELALAWACDTRGTEGWKAARLSMIRSFAVYLRTIDPATEIPPTGVLPHRKRYAIPYLYSDQDVDRLLAHGRGTDTYSPGDIARHRDRTAGGQRHADLRGARPGLRGHRSRRRRADDPQHQVPQVPPAAAAPNDDRRARTLRATPRGALAATQDSELLRLRKGQPARQVHHRAGLSQALPPRRVGRPWRDTSAEAA